MATRTAHNRVTIASVGVWTAGIALVWIVAAFLRSDTTLHLGPLLIPLIPAFLGRDSDHPRRAVLLGIVIGALVVTTLALTGNLDGPALSPFPNALTESIALLAVGSAVGMVYAASARRN